MFRGTMDRQKYVNVLERHIIPFKDKIAVFQHDDTAPHKTSTNEELLKRHEMEVLDCHLTFLISTYRKYMGKY